jgi:hypothetical protein
MSDEGKEPLHPHRRAGGIAGYADEESWWRPGGSCAVTKRMILGLSPFERVSLFADEAVREAVYGAVDEERKAWIIRDAEMVADQLRRKGKVVRKRQLRPWWCKIAEAVDRERKGADQVVGDWVLRPDLECDDGELVLVGLRVPERRYALCRAMPGRRAQLFMDVRPDIVVEGLHPASLGEWASFPEALDAIAAEMGEAGSDRDGG